jgi:hypothetical protein
MDRRPTLETRPPVLIDAVVRTLIPPACREHVVGDLWERYRSPWQFVHDAARAIPFVIASQIRRTSTLAGVVIHAFLLFVSVGSGAGRLWPAVAAVSGALLGFVLRDAYRRGFSISARQVAIDLLFGAIGLLASQAIVALVFPGQLLPLRAYSVCLAGFGVLFLLRLQNPNLGAAVPRQALTVAPATREALVTEIRLFERMSRRGYRIEAGTGVALAGFFIFPLVNAPNWVMRIGWALGAAYARYVAAIVTRIQAPPMAEGLEFEAALAHYRGELERRCHQVQTLWRWYLLPMVPGMLLITLGATIEAAKKGRPLWPALIMVALMGGLGIVIHLSSQGWARTLRIRIDALGSSAQ